jgi:O-antigen/teichoic acid export membrane protein
MFQKLKELTKDTAIYGISTMVGRFLNFLLVPFYTNLFPPSEYGIIQLIYAYIAILNIVYIYGLDSAYLKFAAFKDVGDEKDNFSTPYIAIFLTSIIFSLLIALNSNSIAESLRIPDKYEYLINVVALLLVFDSLQVIPYLKLRLERKAVKFSTFRIINILVNISLNVILILVLKWGIEAIVISNVIASFVSFALVTPEIFKYFRFKIHAELLKRLLKFGLPYLPAGFAVMIVQVIDVPILEKLTDFQTVGIYKANYRMGIFMMLFVNMFQYAWQPFFLTNAKEENAKQMFAKVLTYFTLVASIILVLISLFISDIVHIQISGYSLIGSEYWSGLSIIPIVLFAYLINGMYVIFSAGIYIEEKSLYVPFISGAGALTNVVANFLLIPTWGITGAAVATLLSYLVMTIGYFLVTQKFYKIDYEFNRIFRIFLGITVTAVIYYLLIDKEFFNVYLKFLLLISFFAYTFLYAVNKNEMVQLRNRLLQKRKS